MVEARTLAKKKIFFGGRGGGGNLKNDGFIFSQPYTDDVLRYLNIKVLRNIHAPGDMRSVKI